MPISEMYYAQLEFYEKKLNPNAKHNNNLNKYRSYNACEQQESIVNKAV